MPAKKTTLPPVPFRDILHYGSTGTQPVAVKRGLWNAGFRIGWDKLSGDAIKSEFLGDIAVENLENMQRYNGLDADGIYGPKTHQILKGSFDATACRLYNKPDPQPPAGTVVVPLDFVPTHDTGGLPGFPAIDVFGPPGSRVVLDFDATVTRLSGHPPSQGGPPHGAYGWSTYFTGPHGIWYVTHQATRTVQVGQHVKKGQVVGTVCDARVDGLPVGDSHVHVGKHSL